MNETPRSSFATLRPALARQVDRVCTQFEVAWKDGGRPRIEDFLSGAAEPERSALLRELVLLDAHYRRSQDERPAAGDYEGRFPAEIPLIQRAFAAEFPAAPPAGPALATSDSSRTIVFADPPAPPSTASDRAQPAKTREGTGAGAAAATLKFPNVPGYEILSELGRGGMGVVYQAINRLMDRPEVLKVVSQALLDEPGAAERFLREIRSAAKLSHDNVVKAYSALQVGKRLVFAMEYVEGEDLAKVVKARGPLPVQDACSYVYQAALGLQDAHEHGMVHRDIKPQNLMLSRQGKEQVVKILDFGLAKATREEGADTQLTGWGKMLGTPDYIAPEQMRDAASADIRADIYSLGCTLYFLLTGAPPFKGKSLFEVLQAHEAKDAKPLDQRWNAVPAELAAVVAKMMAKDPTQRYRKPVEVAQALAPFVQAGARPPPSGLAESAAASKFEPPKVSVSKARGGKWLTWAGVAACVLLLGGLVWAAAVRVKTADGSILVVEVNEPNADVFVDGDKVTVTWGEDGKKGAAVIKPGKRKVEVTKDGFTVYGEEVEIKEGKRLIFKAELRQAAPPPGKKKDKPQVTDDGFVKLFNGKDTTGWKTDPSQPGNWRVEHGVLIGSGPATSHLYTEREDYKDFHLRVEARINDGGNSGVFFRTPFAPTPKWPSGYEAQINSTHSDVHKTGSLFTRGTEVLVSIRKSPVPPGEWFTLEVIAEGNHIVIKVNGKTTADYRDETRRFTSGHFAVQQHNQETVAEFRKIEVKELPPDSER